MDPFIGEIKIFGGSFAPKGWAFCSGQLLAIRQYTALFSLLGTNYGGDGTTTFGLPNLQGRIPMQAGQGPGLKQRSLGEQGGVRTVTLNQNQMAAHNHAPGCNSGLSNATTPKGNVWSKTGSARQGINNYADTAGTSPALNTQVFANIGGDQPHNNMPPFLVMNYIIALEGIFPQRP